MDRHSESGLRGRYQREAEAISARFARDADGTAAVAARADLVDRMIHELWTEATAGEKVLPHVSFVAALGGYGRGGLFPYSDLDLLFCVERGEAAAAKDPVRRVTQALWDCGLRVAPVLRTPGECERFEASDPEFALAFLDVRLLAGDQPLFERTVEHAAAKRSGRDARQIIAELGRLTEERYARYGHTLFHLEPNVKDCPGGLRDAQVCSWLAKLNDGAAELRDPEDDGFRAAVQFLTATRWFLHERHGRDDNTLDWLAQDRAAEQGIGLGPAERHPVASGDQAAPVDVAYWMRYYFRHARAVERELHRVMERVGLAPRSRQVARFKPVRGSGLLVKDGLLELESNAKGLDAAEEPEIVLGAFAAMAQSGLKLALGSERRIEAALPRLSGHLEEGPSLWRLLSAVLVGDQAAAALRSMHTLGLLELILPEFHGIDALVIRDAYHRYTVDEHTFVVVEALHALARPVDSGAPDWRLRFGSIIRELPNPELLYLAALLHDTGKGHTGSEHAAESIRMAEGVLKRWELDSYDAELVLKLIEIHLEMSAALRRDIFDAETVRAFAGKVGTHERLRLLTLFTYADIQAVHPDALTPWKAESLWRLYMSTANQIDRSIDEERVHSLGAEGAKSGDGQLKAVLAAATSPERARLEAFLEGFPERYLQTRSASVIREHLQLTEALEREPLGLIFKHGAPVSEITMIARDRPRLFASIASALAAWGMDVLTAEAFANRSGVVVDSFRFTDGYRTLELNPEERSRFVQSVHDIVRGTASAETLWNSRRRGRRKPPRVLVETRMDFSDDASATSTLLQVIAQNTPGLLRALSETLSDAGCNMEVALIDTEGDMAIDVFYLTRGGEKLRPEDQEELEESLREAIERNAR